MLLRGVFTKKIYVSYDSYMFLFVFYVHYADIALDSGTDPEPI